MSTPITIKLGEEIKGYIRVFVFWNTLCQFGVLLIATINKNSEYVGSNIF